MRKLIYWSHEVSQEDHELIGKKCASLAQMAKLDLNVPKGFFISIDAWNRFMDETGLTTEIGLYTEQLAKSREMEIKEVEKAATEIMAFIKNREIPGDLKAEIGAYYQKLCDTLGVPDVPVSVRSAGVESRPGLFETYLNVKGEQSILETIKNVYASAFTPRAIAFRLSRGLGIDAHMLGVAIVKMINARAAGVSFSIDPITKDTTRVIIEATYGLGEGVVKGTESVDRFVVGKESLNMLRKQVGRKEKQLVLVENGVEWKAVPVDKQSESCIKDYEIEYITKVTRSLEEKLGCPQDVEWAIEEGVPFPANIALLQTRPAKVTTDKAESAFEKMCQDITRVFSATDFSNVKISGVGFKW